ncbi:MAG: nucleoside 2-deoxyribosyltransferase [Dehalococcoidia bacterium]|nr:nucleoside 2-deoxyribosyltransferase [Dehalococcoidia bacterium]
MSKGRIYVAGPLSGMKYEDATDWRKRAAEAIEAADYEAVDPGLASCLHYADAKTNGGIITHQDDAGVSAIEIWMRDVERGVLTCDGVLVGFPRTQTSLGVGIEVGVAYMAGIPIMVWQQQSDDPLHVMLQALVHSGQANTDHDLTEAVRRLIALTADTPPTFEAMIGRVLIGEQRRIMRQRQRKYGPYNISRIGLHGVIDRAQNDKFARIEQDHKDCKWRECQVMVNGGRALPDEMGEDAYVDIANYTGPISVSLMRGWWGKDGCPPMFESSG